MRYAAIFLIIVFFVPVSRTGIQPETENSVSREYIEAVQNVVDDLNERSNAAFVEAIDIDAIFERVFTGMKVNARSKRDYISGAKKAKDSFGADIVNYMPDYGYARIVRSKSHKEGAQILMRVDMGDNGFGYQDFILGKSDKGQVRIVDWYSYTSGEFVSDTLRQMFALAEPTTNNLRRLLNIVTGHDITGEQLVEVLNASKENDADKFFNLYDALSGNIRLNRVMLLTALKVSIYDGDDQRYAQILSDLVQHHGDDDSLQFIFLDYYFLEGDFAKSIAALDNLSGHMGIADNAMLALKATILITAGDMEKALQLSETVKASEPTLELNYWNLLSLYAMDNKFDEATVVINTLSQEFGYLFDEATLMADPALQGFAASPEFKEWMAAQ